jgi:GMP synthase (glutamine-hydrolysing)
VFFFVSGGIDSTVAFSLCVEALGKENVKGIYIDTGFMRKNETETIIKKKLDNIEVLDKSNEFISSLRDVYDPEEKRQIIGKMFVEVEKNIFDKINSSNNIWILGQGTIYPDIIESGCSKKSKKIKTHHNRVEEILKLIREDKVIEPISEFYKDEVRALAQELNLPEDIVKKEPFPGPGLAVRCICNPGENIVDHDEELTSILSKHGLKGFIAPVKTVGVQGDFRSYKEIAIIYGNISMSGLGRLSSEIVNTINRINRVAYIVNTTKEDIGKIRIHKACIDRNRLSILREADYIVRKFVENNRERLPDIWQFPVVLFPLGYDRDETIVLRPVLSTDGMTSKFAKIDKNLLGSISQEILKINGISTVLYDVTNKPPSTIEWE